MYNKSTFSVVLRRLIIMLIASMNLHILQANSGQLILKDTNLPGHTIFANKIPFIGRSDQNINPILQQFCLLTSNEPDEVKCEQENILLCSYESNNAYLTQEFAGLSLTSEPENAMIFIDGENTGLTTPAKFHQLVPGTHKITLKLELHSEASRTVRLEAGREKDLFVELEPLYGTLSITCNEKAKIFIDDIPMGIENYSGRLQEGKHTLKVEKENYYTHQESFEILKGTEFTFKIDLKPIAGNLSVVCIPEGSEIYVDGDFKGNSPVFLKDLIIGEHRILISKTGFRSLTKNILIKEYQTVIVNDTLVMGGLELKITSDPVSSDIFINGSFKGKSPVTLILSPGNYNLSIKKDSYSEINKIINLTKDEDLSFTLAPSIQSISFMTFPEKIRGSIDGMSITTEKTISLPGGNHLFRFEKQGYMPFEKTITVNANTDVIKVLLHPEKYRSKGSAMLFSSLFPGSGISYLNRGEYYYYGLGIVCYGLAAGAVIEALSAKDNWETWEKNIGSSPEDDLKYTHDKWKRQESLSNNLAIAAGSLWVVNMVFTLLNSSEQRKYEKLRIRFGFDNQSSTANIGIKGNF